MEDSGVGFLGWMVAWALIWATAVAVAADNKGFEAGNWFLYGLFFGPIAFIHVLAKAPSTEVREKASLTSGEMKPCPECAELVRRAARRCRYCGHQFAPSLGVAPGAAPTAPRPASPESARTASRMRRGMGG